MLPPVKSQKAVYDVVIVGGGLAGLTAGYLLKDLNILVLEKEAQAGGRILSHSADGIPYDLGAVFAYNPGSLPFEVNSSGLIRESEQIGIFYGGQVHYGSSPIDCLKKLDLEPHYLQQLDNFQVHPAQKTARLSDKLYTLLNAFFQVIHPGDIWDYLPSLQQDALRKFSTDHYETSNGDLIEQFQSHLGSLLNLNTQVIEIIDKQSCVQLIIETADDIETLWAKTVILTTPAPIALSLLKSIQEPCQSFLQSVQYGRGTVVAIGFKNLELTSFAYLVTPDLPSATIIQHNIQHNSNKVLLVYYVGEVSAQLQAIPNQQIIQQTLGILQQLGIGDISEDKVLFTDVHHWPMVGTIISEDSYGQWKQQLSHPSRRVWLAGDYVFANTEQIIPYGMQAAILSGKQVVKKVKQYLNKEFFAELITKKTPSEQFKSNFLIDTSIYQLSSDKPVFLENKEEGNIAFYGLILQAHPDKTLQTYLLNQATTEHLWEYQIDYGITADDSALVIEGLMETGVSDQVLMPSLKKLVECFYDSEQGAFRTIRKQGRAVYWQFDGVNTQLEQLHQ
ncbi:FAD-dependent oxidoreductase [Moorena sp. SIO4G3]|uniref:FAD-dependent oxidoreductase n=1 Tax=Moorena sp. SIO4G3 TaxID=2607821 RepID=UPI0014299883|nr:FAD-dependent oxidoreductase [Moorena sp. SIO4G3]NEO77656.1 FAD-dependent oxidoreductase [Moorena sp. SIO4G3]